MFSGLAAVGDGANGLARFVFQGFSLLQDVELSGTVGDHGRLLDGVGHVAVIVLDVTDEQGAAGRPVELHVPHFIDGVERMANVRNAPNGHTHGDGNERVHRPQTTVDNGDVGVFGKQNVVRPRQPRLRAAGERKAQLTDFHGLSVAAGQAFLDLVVALDVDDTAGGTCRTDHGRGEPVEDGPDVEDNFNHRQKRVIEDLSEGVQVGVVKVHAAHAGRREQETALDDDDAWNVFDFNQHGRAVP